MSSQGLLKNESNQISKKQQAHDAKKKPQ